ncbi:MAG: 7,8-didemethyl-8-hydroxy-5-deazariboflavin synthase subunit 1 / 7,8-didemethyl-8-hydroxy-5-deazariboflavin synthase subunit 2, partial [uncultured Rubrobacteraceae bacterium]
ARGDGRWGEAREDLRAGMGGIRRPRAGDEGGVRGPRQGLRAARNLLAQGIYPPHQALPRQLRLLHLRPRPPPRRERLPDAGGGAGDRAGGCRGGVQGGALHARGQAREALPGGQAGAAADGLRDDNRVPGPLLPARSGGDGATSPRQPRGALGGRGAESQARLRLAGDHAGAGLRPAARPEPRPLGLAGQGAGQAPK